MPRLVRRHLRRVPPPVPLRVVRQGDHAAAGGVVGSKAAGLVHGPQVVEARVIVGGGVVRAIAVEAHARQGAEDGGAVVRAVFGQVGRAGI